MNDVEKIKEIIKKDENFSKSFLGVKDVKTALAIARSKGYGDITADDILNDKELEDSLLCAAAGGYKDNTKIKNETHEHKENVNINVNTTKITGNNNQQQSKINS